MVPQKVDNYNLTMFVIKPKCGAEMFEYRIFCGKGNKTRALESIISAECLYLTNFEQTTWLFANDRVKKTYLGE